MLSKSVPLFLNRCTNYVRRLVPQDCLLCGTPCDSERLCSPCRASLPYHRMACCPLCAIPVPDGQRCGECLKHPPAYNRTLVALSYVFPVDAMIQALKYSGKLSLAPLFADFLVERVKTEPKSDLLIPMPLHVSRLRERGFNQSLEIGKIVAKKLALPVFSNACQRTRETRSQADLPRNERARNVRGAFDCQADLKDKKIAVLDDVMTSGATLNELSKVLHRRGAAEITGWIVARTLPH